MYVRARSLVFSVVVSLVAVVFLVPGGLAFAASFAPTNVTVAVDRNTVTQGYGETITSTLSFCVPDAQSAGDSFTVTLPEVLSNWPAGFSLLDGTGQAVIEVSISSASPAVATFTLTTYGGGVDNLCAIAKFGADSGSSAAGTYPLDYVVGTTTITPPTPTLTVEPQPIESAPTEPNKIGWFPNNANQCRDTTENCLLWNFRTAGGDRGLVTFTDTAPAGWSFACVIAYAAKVTYGPSGLEYEDINDPLSVLTGYSCSPTQLTFSLDTSVLAADQIYYFEMLASASAPGGDGGIRYTNTVQVTEGQNPPTDLSAFTSSAYVGGAASGDGIRIYKRDAAGNDANTTTTAVTLPNGTTELSFLIRNTGTTDLTGITVTDTITQGSPPASVSGLSCNFSEAVDGAPTSGTTWAGPFPTNSGFTCSATLSGVQGYSTDVASVAATGNGPVGSSDPYVAFTPVVPKVSIGDYVWYDINRNGLQDDNSPASGVTVTLKDEAGSDVGTAVTNADGYYWFTDLVGGAAYTLVFTAPDGYSWTTKDAGGVSDNNLVTDTNDSDVTPTDGMIAFTAPLDGDNVGGAPGITDNPTLDGGLVKYDLTLTKTLVTAGPYRPGQTVVYTLTPQNLGPAAALPGWSVTDVLPSGLTAVGISGSDSSYSCELSSLTCTNDQPFPAAADLGAVTVTATIDAAATAVTLNNLGYVTPADTDVPETIPLGTPPTTADATPDFDANATDTNNDANAPLTLTPYVSVGDYVWLDTNRDGLQSDGEDPVSGVVVNLYDAAGVLVGTTTTNDDGFYVFTDLLAGAAYTIEFVKPDGTTLTTPNVAGGDDALDSDAPADTGKVEFIAPASGTNSASEPDNPTIDAGLVTLVSVGDYVWLDTNRDGLQSDGEDPVSGVVVNLYDAAGVLVGTSTTNDDGFYVFTDLLAGAAYTIEFVKPDGTTLTTPNVAGGDDALDSDAPADTGKVEFIAPASGTNSASEPDNPTIDAGLVTLVSVGDYVWLDTNRDGLQSDGEDPVSGVVVNLYDAAGVLVGTSTTNDDGFYVFTDLLAGAAYTIEFVKPDGTTLTTPNVAGGDDALDSDAPADTGKVEFIAPASGTNSASEPDNPTIDAGLVTLVSVGDYVWLDTNRDGLQSDGEDPVSGVVVNLYDAAGVLVGTSTTNDDGFYVFTDLLAGAAYTIEFVKPDGTTLTTPNVAGGDDALDSDAPADTGKVEFIAPASGTNSASEPDNPTIDAGLVTLVSVGDYVWLDTNRDGLQSDGEDPVSGVVVNLYDAAGVLVGTSTTNDDGFYVFTDLLAGAAYTIEFVKPDGTTLTTPNVAGGDDALDSDAPADTGKVEFIAPASGTNSASEPDNPTIDAGLVKFNLSLSKALSTSGAIHPGDVVSFILTPHNDGPADALAGWTVTEVLPGGLSLVSMSGAGYSCSGATCIAAGALPAGSDGPTITVVAKVTGTGDQRNVAYIDRATGDGDEVIPLGPVPPSGTDTEATPTDNDAMADLVATSEVLPQTGADLIATATLGFGLILLGGLVLLLTGRGTRRARQV